MNIQYQISVLRPRFAAGFKCCVSGGSSVLLISLILSLSAMGDPVSWHPLIKAHLQLLASLSFCGMRHQCPSMNCLGSGVPAAGRGQRREQRTSSLPSTLGDECQSRLPSLQIHQTMEMVPPKPVQPLTLRTTPTGTYQVGLLHSIGCLLQYGRKERHT